MSVLRRAILILASSAQLSLAGASGVASAGTLGIYESSGSSGSFLVIPGEASSVLIDVEYDPLSAEGGGLFGLSEVAFFTTGDVVFDMSGFTCLLANCMVAPELFVGGNFFRVTGGDDLNGAFSVGVNLLTVRISGNSGYVGVARGAYLDATDPGPAIGDVQAINLKLLARVPEPTVALGSLMGSLALVLATRRRARTREAATTRDYESANIRSIGSRACFASSSGTLTRGPSFFRQS